MMDYMYSTLHCVTSLIYLPAEDTAKKIMQIIDVLAAIKQVVPVAMRY